MLSDEQLKAIRERCEAAPAGPWRVSERHDSDWSEDDVMTESVPSKRICNMYGGLSFPPGLANAGFIAHARQDVPDLLDEIERLKSIIAKHDLCHDLHGQVGQAEFEEGCRRESIKEHGSCAWADEIERLKTALHDAIDRPMGVVPDSALEFYRPD